MDNLDIQPESKNSLFGIFKNRGRYFFVAFFILVLIGLGLYFWLSRQTLAPTSPGQLPTQPKNPT